MTKKQVLRSVSHLVVILHAIRLHNISESVVTHKLLINVAKLSLESYAVDLHPNPRHWLARPHCRANVWVLCRCRLHASSPSKANHA